MLCQGFNQIKSLPVIAHYTFLDWIIVLSLWFKSLLVKCIHSFNFLHDKASNNLKCNMFWSGQCMHVNGGLKKVSVQNVHIVILYYVCVRLCTRLRRTLGSSEGLDLGSCRYNGRVLQRKTFRDRLIIHSQHPLPCMYIYNSVY